MHAMRFWTVWLLFVVGMLPLHASKRILVDLTHQVAIAYQDGKVKFFGRISSGKPGRETPTGSFYVHEKDIDHVSNLWPKPNGGAKMHYMLRITRDGIAMHLGPTPNYPASHGCIRMQNGFAQRMFAWADKWVKVDIVGKAPAHSPAVALPAFARSARVLRRSLGGGNGNPLNLLSSNPKVNGASSDRLVVNNADTATSVKRSSRRSHHVRPLDLLNAHQKHRVSTKRRLRKKSRRRGIRTLRKKRNPHPNPLHIVRSN